MKLGLITRMDKSGLGQGQTLRLARLLNPDRVLLIDSTSFNGSKQHPEWYAGFEGMITYGFPTDDQVRLFLDGLDTVISCETFYNNRFTRIAKEMKVKTILVANPEFFDWFKPEWALVPRPDKIVVPSQWLMDKMLQFNAQYIPTPIFEDEFAKAREINLQRTGKRRYLFLNGKTAAHDRNGLESFYTALEQSRDDFEVVVKAQGDVKKHPDPRVTYDTSNPDEQWKLYADFDAMILPRRYAGQCLPMMEALSSGLPVVMTDIDPNNKVLPKELLIPATKTDSLMTRFLVDIYSADVKALAEKLDNLEVTAEAKAKALDIAKQFDAEILRPRYEELRK